MNEIIFSNYKFKFALNDTTLNIQIRNIINNNLFEGTINEHEVKSIKKFYKMILNALNKTEHFNILINEKNELININVNYDSDFTNIEEFFALNKINKCYLQDEINGLKKDIAMLISHNKLLEQKIEQLEGNEVIEQQMHKLTFKNDVSLTIFLQYQTPQNSGTLFLFSPYNFSFHFEHDNCKNNSVYMINYDNIHIELSYRKEIEDSPKKQHNIVKFLQTYSELNKHVINKIWVSNFQYKCGDQIYKTSHDISKTLGGLTNYKELFIEDDQLVDHCKKNNIKFLKPVSNGY